MHLLYDMLMGLGRPAASLSWIGNLMLIALHVSSLNFFFQSTLTKWSFQKLCCWSSLVLNVHNFSTLKQFFNIKSFSKNNFPCFVKASFLDCPIDMSMDVQVEDFFRDSDWSLSGQSHSSLPGYKNNFFECWAGKLLSM